MMTGRALTASKGIARDRRVAAMLGCPIVRGFKQAQHDDVVVGWGKKKNTRAAKRFAGRAELPYWHLEDGFFAYLSHPAVDPRRMAMVVDRTGIYYDATAASDLELLLNRDDWVTPALITRAEQAMDRVRRWRLSKYNKAPLVLPASLKARLDKFDGPKVMIVDQTWGDLSLKLGGASDDAFQRMLAAALAEHPGALVIIKVHPDVLEGTKRSHFGDAPLPERVMLVADYVNPQTLMAEVEHVYVATSQMGFEALIAGKKVTCFGLPFYAGWGLTDDRVVCARRKARRTLPELFAAACILYSRYIDPFTLKLAELEDVLDLLVADKQLPRAQATRALCVGFSVWRRQFAAAFLKPGVAEVAYVRPSTLGKIRYRDGDIVVLWSRKHDADAAAIPARVPVWRMEDGFLRSVGLGSDLSRPSSLVLDRTGIYFDGGVASDLETFLATHEFEDRDLARGARLMAAMQAARVSKYNVGVRGDIDFRAGAEGRPVILVPGQVETDASLRYGSPVIHTNGDLLMAVRAQNPDAYIVYKAHPDVLSGNRIGWVAPDILKSCVDELVGDADIIDCLDAVDSVHLMTSLTGFEALMRGKAVTTYGMPFYAGWGLTTDILPLERRGRALTVDALVYALYCVYARYVCWPGAESYSPEALISDLAGAVRSRPITAFGPVASLLGLGRKAKFLLEAVIR